MNKEERSAWQFVNYSKNQSPFASSRYLLGAPCHINFSSRSTGGFKRLFSHQLEDISAFVVLHFFHAFEMLALII